MTTLSIAPKTDFTPLEPNYYTLTLESCEVRDRDADKFHVEAYQDVQFEWRVDVPDGDPLRRRSWANVPRGYNEKSTLIQIGVALGAIDPVSAAANGVDLDLDRWVGRSCRGNVVEITKADGTISDKIASYAPLKPRAAAKPATTRRAPKPPPWEEGDEGDEPF